MLILFIQIYKEHYKKYLELIELGVSHSTVLEACSYLSDGEEKSELVILILKMVI